MTLDRSGPNPRAPHWRSRHLGTSFPADLVLEFIARVTTARPPPQLDVSRSRHQSGRRRLRHRRRTVARGSQLRLHRSHVPPPLCSLKRSPHRSLYAAAGILVKLKAAISPYFTASCFLQPGKSDRRARVPSPGRRIKVTLKVSQNLHAGMGLYLLGALIAKDTKDPLRAGVTFEHISLKDASSISLTRIIIPPK